MSVENAPDGLLPGLSSLLPLPNIAADTVSVRHNSAQILVVGARRNGAMSTRDRQMKVKLARLVGGELFK